MDADLKHKIKTDVPEVKSCGVIRGGKSREECGSELCTSVGGEPWLVRRRYKMQNCEEKSQNGTENEGNRTE